jgi:DNA-binding protein HU-beta
MTKNELAGKVADSAGLGVGQARGAVDAVFDAIADELARGGEVSVAGFGKFGAALLFRPPASIGTGTSFRSASAFQAINALMLNPAETKKAARPTITQTPAGVLRVRPFRRGEPVEREAFGKGFAISHTFQLIRTKIANTVQRSVFTVRRSTSPGVTMYRRTRGTQRLPRSEEVTKVI